MMICEKCKREITGENSTEIEVRLVVAGLGATNQVIDVKFCLSCAEIVFDLPIEWWGE
jgi:hypothetical protein